jgi:hypothetical protein
MTQPLACQTSHYARRMEMGPADDWAGDSVAAGRGAHGVSHQRRASAGTLLGRWRAVLADASPGLLTSPRAFEPAKALLIVATATSTPYASPDRAQRGASRMSPSAGFSRVRGCPSLSGLEGQLSRAPLRGTTRQAICATSDTRSSAGLGTRPSALTANQLVSSPSSRQLRSRDFRVEHSGLEHRRRHVAQ